MLKKIVKELEDIEKEAEGMIQNAQKEAEGMIQEEMNRQVENREELILELNKKGQKLLQETIANAHAEAKDIYEISVIEQKEIKQNTVKKFEEAVQIILKQIVK